MLAADHTDEQTVVQPAAARETDGTLLVYRDRIIPRSEAAFLGRQYEGFTRLTPVWIGRRRGDGIDELGVAPVILGGPGPLGAIDRALYKHLGRLPRRPDLAALRPVAIHAHFGKGGALALPMARALQIPLIVTFHGGDATKEMHYRRRLVPTVFQRRLPALKDEATAFVCVSEYIRRRLVERGFPPDRLHVIRYGVDSDDADQVRPSSVERPYVLFVGRFVKKKGIGFLIEAMRRLEARGVDLELAIIGDGPMADCLKAQTASLRAVKFLGWLPHQETRRWMRGALALCVPSVDAETGDAEGLPNVVIEGMAEGAAVIGTRHGGIGEAIEDGVTGILVPPGDPDAIANACQFLHQDPTRRRGMGEAARQRATLNFNAKIQSEMLEDLILSIIDWGSASAN